MKRNFAFGLLTLLLTIALSSAAAYADTVKLTLTNPNQFIALESGGTLTYSANCFCTGQQRCSRLPERKQLQHWLAAYTR